MVVGTVINNYKTFSTCMYFSGTVVGKPGAGDYQDQSIKSRNSFSIYLSICGIVIHVIESLQFTVNHNSMIYRLTLELYYLDGNSLPKSLNRVYWAETSLLPPHQFNI